MQRFLPAMTLAFALAPPAVAMTPDGQYSAHGLGTRPCKDFTGALSASREQRERRRIDEHLTWLQGYFTAYNFIVRDTFDITGPIKDEQVYLTFIENYCREHPDKKVGTAAEHLVKQLHYFRARSPRPEP
jgi:hypothetical protein